MKGAKWYYKEFDKVEKELKECESDSQRLVLEKQLDQLYDEFVVLDDDDDDE